MWHMKYSPIFPPRLRMYEKYALQVRTRFIFDLLRVLG